MHATYIYFFSLRLRSQKIIAHLTAVIFIGKGFAKRYKRTVYKSKLPRVEIYRAIVSRHIHTHKFYRVLRVYDLYSRGEYPRRVSFSSESLQILPTGVNKIKTPASRIFRMQNSAGQRGRERPNYFYLDEERQSGLAHN